jgi:crotonobetainyl-CoA:carnitine CoA-transferase CaiB-like acyl-CoA transferase
VIFDWRQFPSLARIIGREDLLADPKWSTIVSAMKHRKGLIDILDAGFKTLTQEEACKALKMADIAFDRVNTTADCLTDPQAAANSYLYQVTLPSGEALTYPAAPVQFGNIAVHEVRGAPPLVPARRKSCSAWLSRRTNCTICRGPYRLWANDRKNDIMNRSLKARGNRPDHVCRGPLRH